MNTLAFSPDEQFLAVGSDEIHLWNITLSNQIKILPSPENYHIQHLLFSKDGSEIIASGFRQTNPSNLIGGGSGWQIMFWNVSTGNLEPEKTIPLTIYSRDIALSPDGSILVTGTVPKFPSPGAQIVTLWNLSTGSVVKNLTGFNGAIRTMAFTPDGNYLAVSSVTSSDNSPCIDGIGSKIPQCSTEITLWNLQTYKEAFNTPLNVTGAVYQFGFSSRNHLFISSSYSTDIQKDLHIWKKAIDIGVNLVNRIMVSELIEQDGKVGGAIEQGKEKTAIKNNSAEIIAGTRNFL